MEIEWVLPSDPVPSIRYHVALDDQELSRGFETLRNEIGVEPHPPEAIAEADEVARRGPTMPPGVPDSGWTDRTDLHLVAIDPPGSRDLDQAFGAERRGAGYRVHYAIADVAAFVAPGGAIEAASLERGVTLYAPDRRASLHPEVINEDVASLLPGVERVALLWTIDLAAGGEIEQASLRRSTVQVSEAMSYRAAQDEIDSGNARECLALLAEIGEHRLRLERERDAVSLAIPAQEVERDEHGHLHLVFDETLHVEIWNAQISLLTGIAAARLMVDAGIGMLRTLPPADEETVAALRRTARGLGVDWPENESYAERVRDLDPNDRAEVTLLTRSARGLRGAGYVSFLRPDELPTHREHSAIASIYAHVTAPLRRVCDRYANEVILAICDEREVPAWVQELLPELPSIMGRTTQRERALERAVLDYMEAMVLEPFVGQTFDAIVVNHRRDEAVIQLREPAVIARVQPKPQLGQEIRVKLISVDPLARHVQFERVD